MSSPAVWVPLLVLGILGAQAVMWLALFRWLRKKTARFVEEMRADLAASGEKILRGPEPGVYRGASDRYPPVKGNCVLALTERRLVIRRLMGDPIEVPVAEFVGVREDPWFLRSYVGGRPHVIVALGGGAELGFFAANHGKWMNAIRALAGQAA